MRICPGDSSWGRRVRQGRRLEGAEHNLAVRLDILRGRIDQSKVHDGGRELHESYVAMAIANGIHENAPELKGGRWTLEIRDERRDVKRSQRWAASCRKRTHNLTNGEPNDGQEFAS